MEKNNRNLEKEVAFLLHQLTEGKGVHLDEKTKKLIFEKTVKTLKDQGKDK